MNIFRIKENVIKWFKATWKLIADNKDSLSVVISIVALGFAWNSYTISTRSLQVSAASLTKDYSPKVEILSIKQVNYIGYKEPIFQLHLANAGNVSYKVKRITLGAVPDN